MNEAARSPSTGRGVGDLMLAARAGDRVAFGELINTVRDKLYEEVVGLLRVWNRDGWAEDICQDTLAKLVTLVLHAPRTRLVRISANLPGYLYRTAVNLVTDRHRRERKVATVRKLEDDLQSTQSLREREFALNREQAETLIGLLPASLQPYFRLRFLDGYSRAEAAQQLNIKVGAAYGRERRGMAILKRQLAADPQLVTRIRGPE